MCNDVLGLTCPISLGSCNCPTLSNKRFCDCVKTMNNENFWNGIRCQNALIVGQSCSSGYMCQTLTQGTICNGTSGVYTCQCPFLQYYDNVTNFCINQLPYKSKCSYSSQCQNAFGLTCTNGLCLWVCLLKYLI